MERGRPCRCAKGPAEAALRLDARRPKVKRDGTDCDAQEGAPRASIGQF
jgi:hypothetical protein